MAEAFRDAGYATLSLSSSIFTGSFTNLQQGFDEVHEDSSLPNRFTSKTSRVYVDRLLPWIELHRDLPFFVFLHVTDPHDPYRPDPPFDSLWADQSLRDKHEEMRRDARKWIRDSHRRLTGMPTRAELETARIDPVAYVQYEQDLYDGAVREMDNEVGRVVEQIRRLGLTERTIIAFTSDHGEEFLEHGRLFHGQTTYGELSNVPLIMWGPGAVPAGRVIESTTALIDLLPTLLDFGDIVPPPGLEGVSLKMLANGQASPLSTNRPIFVEKSLTSDPTAPSPNDTESYGMILGGMKVVRYLQDERGKERVELFDHVRDPLDQVNLAANETTRLTHLEHVLDQWLRPRWKLRDGRPLPPQQQINPDQAERLRALGY
jgi:arylsulfatase A-like enzyme